MAKHQGVNESEIKAAIKAAQTAIRDRERLAISPSQRARLLSPRRELGERLQQVFAEAGVDIEKINTILAENQRDVLSVLKDEKSKTVRSLGALHENLRYGIENRRKALEWLALRPPVTTTVIPLWTASEIGVTPNATLVDTHIEASNNQARFLFTSQTDTSGDGGKIDVGFWFAWQNPSEYLAVLNAQSDLVVQGSCEAIGNPELLWHGESKINLSIELAVFQAGKVGTGFTNIKWLDAKGSAEIFLGGYGTDSAVLSDVYQLGPMANIFVEQPLVLFFVHFLAEYSIRDGSVDLDFGKQQDHFIMCPGVQIELLTAPAGAAA
jgi:hypothetical protein